MKTLAVVFSLALATGAFAQTRSFGSVVFPGGTSSTTPGISRNFGSAVFPGGSSVPTVHGGAPAIGVHPPAGVFNSFPVQSRTGQAFRRTNPGRNNVRSQQYVYAYPAYVGGGYDNGYANGYGPQDQAPPQQAAPPNVTVVYPPNQRANPVMIQAGPNGEYFTSGQRQGAMIYDAPGTAPAVEDQPEPSDSNRYLIAFKDHTIYSAVAYWADGDTLHYFTTGNVHNQASVSLIDRELTERLNKELGLDFKLPPAAK
jgi:hypothetical protein